MNRYENGIYIDDVTTQYVPYTFRLNLDRATKTRKHIDEAQSVFDCVMILMCSFVEYTRQDRPTLHWTQKWAPGREQDFAVYFWTDLHFSLAKYPSSNALSRAMAFLRSKFNPEEYRQFLSSESTIDLNLRAFVVFDNNMHEIRQCILSDCSWTEYAKARAFELERVYDGKLIAMLCGL